LCCLLLQAVTIISGDANHCTESTTEDLVVVYDQTGELLEDLIKRHPKMTSLEATNSNLTTLPKVFQGRQCFLKNLDLSYNHLTELETYQFYQIVNLESLSLANNRLTNLKGSTFQRLGNVQRLNLSHNHLENLELTVFDPLYSLKELKLDNNHLKAVKLSWFIRATKLTNLELQCNQIENIEKIGYARESHNFSVQELNLSSNSLSDLSFLADCKYLNSLDLSNNINANFNDQTFEHNNQLMNLTMQNVSLNRVGEGFPRIFNSLNLQQLDIGYNHLESMDFRQMPKWQILRGLKLTGNALKVFIIGDLADCCPNLKAIDITGHQLDESTLESLMQYCHDHHIFLRLNASKVDHFVYISWFLMGFIVLVDIVLTLGLDLSVLLQTLINAKVCYSYQILFVIYVTGYFSFQISL
jgi:Leucine-rich repeat (LRR) protein